VNESTEINLPEADKLVLRKVRNKKEKGYIKTVVTCKIKHLQTFAKMF